MNERQRDFERRELQKYLHSQKPKPILLVNWLLAILAVLAILAICYLITFR